MIHRWVRAQRVSLAAYSLELPTPQRSEAGPLPVSNFFGEVRSFLEKELDTDQESSDYFTENLPPIALEALLAIRPGRLGSRLVNRRQSWEAVLNGLLGRAGNGDTVPVVVGARTMAHHILNGVGRPISVLRLGKSVLSNLWRNYEFSEGIRDAMEDGLAVLRSPWTQTAARIEAIDSISHVLNMAPYWPQIENALLHQVFVWPLMVFGQGGDAVSLPVGIDISFGGTGTVKTKPPKGGALDVSAWSRSLRYSVDAAKILWRGKHGNFGSFRDAVLAADVTFDFEVAERVVSGFPGRLTLRGSSMEAYFSQVVLSRMLGNVVSSASVVTGRIGMRRWDEPGGFADFEFVWPALVPAKLRYVLKSQFFERMILPDIDEQDSRRATIKALLSSASTRQTTEVQYAKHLQHVADSFQVGGWRQFRYVRCPDVGWRIHPSGKRLPDPAIAPVRSFCATLRENGATVLEVPYEIDTIHVATALWHINMTLRNQIPLTSRPPMLSWVFIRAIPDEQDTRFWQVLWEQTGAGIRAFREFHRASTTDQAAHLLADALNSFTPQPERPSHRAPDLVVLIGTDRLSASLEKAKNPQLRSHAFDPMIARLREEQLLEPTYYAKMRELIGNTRIIIIRSEHDVKEVNTKTRRDSLEETLLARLDVFRFGFTQQMARFVWADSGVDSVPVRQYLEQFVSSGRLRYSFGEYHVPGKVGLSQAYGRTDAERARSQLAAGVALAPYVSVRDSPGLAFDQAFHAQRVHEAHFHLHEAHDLLEKSEGDSFRGRVQTALLRLQRFAEYPGWNVVNQLLKAGNASKDAYELSVELLWDRAQGVAVHPMQFLTAAQATEQRWTELRQDPNFRDPDELDRLRKQIGELFGSAAKSSEQPEYSAERDYNRLSVISRHITFLERHEGAGHEPADEQVMADLRAEAYQLLKDGVDGSAARGMWYECEGDRIVDHRSAASLYGLGVRWAPEWHQLWIKLLGCVALGSEDLAVPDLLSDLDQRIENILKYSLPGVRRDAKRGGPWLRLRWTEGLAFCQRRFGQDRRLMRQIELYRKPLREWEGRSSTVPGIGGRAVPDASGL